MCSDSFEEITENKFKRKKMNSAEDITNICEHNINIDNDGTQLSPLDMKLDESNIFLNTQNFCKNKKSLSFSEINSILLQDGYATYNYEFKKNEEVVISEFLDLDSETIKLQNFLSCCEDKECKFINELLIQIKNSSRKTRRKATKFLKAFKDKNLLIQRLIYFVLTFKFSDEEKARILDILILSLENLTFDRIKIVCIILSKYSITESLKHKCYEVFKLIFRDDVLSIVALFDDELRYREIKVKQTVARIFAFATMYDNFQNTNDIYANIIDQGNIESILTVIETYFYIVSFYKQAIIKHLSCLDKVINLLIKTNDPEVKSKTANLIHFISKILRNNNSKFFNTWFLELERNLESFYRKTENLDRRWCSSFLRAMASLSGDNEDFIDKVIKWINLRTKVDISTIKIINTINLDVKIGNLLQKCYDIPCEFLEMNVPLKRNLLVSFFRKLIHLEAVKGRLMEMVNNVNLRSMVLEILLFQKNLLFNSNEKEILSFKIIESIKDEDDFVVHNIDRLLETNFITDDLLTKVSSICEEFFRKSNLDKRISSLKIYMKISRLFSTDKLVYLSSILFEYLGESDENLTSWIIDVLNNIYINCRIKRPEEIILELRPLFRTKSRRISGKLSKFLLCIIEQENEINIDAKEWIRLCYDIVDSFAFIHTAFLRDSVKLLGEIARFIHPQEISNILLRNLTSENKNTRKGSIYSLVSVSKIGGLYNVLPYLITDYANDSQTLRLSILKVANNILRNLGSDSVPYLYSLLSLVENSLHDPDPLIRVQGIYIAEAMLYCYKKPLIDVDFMIHLLNITWINILENDRDIKKAFDSWVTSFSLRLGTDYLFKYLALGLYHPSKKIKKRYTDLFTKICKMSVNGCSGFSYLGESPDILL